MAITIAEFIANIGKKHAFWVNNCPIEWGKGTYDCLQDLKETFIITNRYNWRYYH